MSVCASCGMQLVDDSGICAYHHQISPWDQGEWSQSNRAMCNFVHRGVVLPRVPEPEWWAMMEAT